MQGRIIPIQTTQAPDIVPARDDDHVLLAERFLAEHRPRYESRKQANLTSVDAHYEVTRRNRVALIVAPEWTQLAPPYGIARMSAISKYMGFTTRVWDINIRTMHEAGCSEYWTAYEDWKWTDPHYSQNVHPKIEATVQKYIDQIIEWQPDIIGFSSWYTNDTCTRWIAQRFRQALPGTKLILGGANATQMKTTCEDQFDHIVSGEGELWWVRILEYYENPQGTLPQICVQDKNQRVDLDSMPPADYSDIDISLYSSGGISCEFSRGCVANCVYCNETVFWKYRSRMASRVIEEIEIAYRDQGIRSVWFIDSLLNGKLPELRYFAEELIARDIRISWSGYSRIDGRIDIEFWRLLKASGCSGFAFGIESGSQRVLDLMKKNCRVEWIEQNMRDFYELDWCNQFATWFTGFPGEELTDVAQTQTLLWRLRESGMSNQSSGTCGLGHGTPLDLERERFGVDSTDWCWGWATRDGKNTVFNRFIRWKTTNVLLEQFRAHAIEKTHCLKPARQYATLVNHYSIESNPDNWVKQIPWEKDFDYHIIKDDINPIANYLVNEIWPVLRVFWLGMGAYKFSLKFDPNQDLEEFGYLRYPRGGHHQFWATYKFEINDSGMWHADFDMKLIAEPWQSKDTDFEFRYKHSGQWTRPLS